MNKLLAILCFTTAISVAIAAFPEGLGAVGVGLFFALGCFAVLNKFENKEFLIRVFITALLVRIIFGSLIYLFDLTGFFGSDASTYNFLGNRLLEIWSGVAPTDDLWGRRLAITTGSGWGMYRIVAALYFFTGQNLLAAQFLSSVVGAATSPAVYICANRIFRNRRTSETAAWVVAFCPSLIIWSSQLLKDGYLIFLLVVIMICVSKLQEKFSYLSVLILTLSLFGILSLRFYIFYMVVVAVIGSFIIGTKSTSQSILSRLIIVLVVGLSLTYLGVLRNANAELDEFTSLERIQRSRISLAESADSGFGKDLDVSTSNGAIAALPVGFTYLMLAPFPWNMTSVRQIITLPEMLLWWGSIPFLLTGLWYAVKNRLRMSIGILMFTLMLTIAYSIFQGNVGTAYRQRAQIQVFHFMFIAVGWSISKEKKENRDAMRKIQQQSAMRRLQGRSLD